VSGARSDALASLAGAAESAARAVVTEEAVVSGVADRSAFLVQPTPPTPARVPMTSRDIDGVERERDMYMSPVE
jgi:hypothetical protein